MPRKKQVSGQGAIDRMIEEVRAAVTRCKEPERKVYEALVEEAEGWKIRLSKLEEDDEEAE